MGGVMRLVVLLGVLVASGFDARAQSLTRLYQDNWNSCLNVYYAMYSRQSPNKSSAADQAFQSCTADENALWTFSRVEGVKPSAFLAAKAEMKERLLTRGNLLTLR